MNTKPNKSNENSNITMIMDSMIYNVERVTDTSPNWRSHFMRLQINATYKLEPTGANIVITTPAGSTSVEAAAGQVYNTIEALKHKLMCEGGENARYPFNQFSSSVTSHGSVVYLNITNKDVSQMEKDVLANERQYLSMNLHDTDWVFTDFGVSEDQESKRFVQGFYDGYDHHTLEHGFADPFDGQDKEEAYKALLR